MCSTNSFLSPEYFDVAGPFKYALAVTLSSFRADKHLANTDSPKKEVQ